MNLLVFCIVRKFLGILGLLIYLGALFKPTIPVLTYLLNQDYFATVLCINKDKPKMKCNGHCQVKRMAEESNEKQNQSKEHIVQMEQLVASLIPEVPHFNCFADLQKEAPEWAFHCNSFEKLDDPWHPPTFKNQV